MNKKLIFLDIDGTIFDNDRDMIHDSTLEALQILQEREDRMVFISTGRSLFQAKEVLDRYNLTFDGYVLINGQLVYYNDEVILDQPLHPDFITRFVAECERLDLPYGLISPDFSVISSKHPLILKAFEGFKMDLPRVIEPEDLTKTYYQGLFFTMDYFDYFSQLFEKDAQFYAWMSNTGADIVAKGASKAVGIEAIRHKLNVKREAIYAVGDSTNDIEMLEYAHVGIAMGNAKDETKRVSDYVTDRIEEDGLYKALKYFDLI